MHTHNVHVGQRAAFDRLHNGDGLAVLLADLQTFAALHTGILPVRIVDLKLHEIHLRVLLEQLVQQGGVSMETEAPVLHQALFLLLCDKTQRW